MGNVIPMPAGGGGADLDAVTATEHDVLAGKVIVDKDGDPVTGTMPDNPAISVTLSAGESTQIPEGHVPGGTVAARDLASQTPGNASAGSILQDESAWVNGQQIVGNIQSMGGQSVAPQTYQQVVSCAWKRMTDNIVVEGAALPPADAIKKGYRYWIGGSYVDGTFEGYIPGPNDLYYMGSNPAGFEFSQYIAPRLCGIEVLDYGFDKYSVETTEYNFGNYSGIGMYLNMCNGAHSSKWIAIDYNQGHGQTYNKWIEIGSYEIKGSSCLDLTNILIPIHAPTDALQIRLRIQPSIAGCIYRIWLE